MKKYSLYIITIPLAIATIAFVLWVQKGNIEDTAKVESLDSVSVDSYENTTESVVADYFKCPEDYASKEKYAEDLVMYAKNYQTEHPNSTDDDLIEERNNQLVRHGCRNNLESIFSQELRNKKIGIDNFLERYGVLRRSSTSGDMRFDYYDIQQKKVLDNFEGHPWFFASKDESMTDEYFKYLQENKDAVFRIVGKKEKDDCDYYGNGICLEDIVVEEIGVYK